MSSKNRFRDFSLRNDPSCLNSVTKNEQCPCSLSWFCRSIDLGKSYPVNPGAEASAQQRMKL